MLLEVRDEITIIVAEIEECSQFFGIVGACQLRITLNLARSGSILLGEISWPRNRSFL